MTFCINNCYRHEKSSNFYYKELWSFGKLIYIKSRNRHVKYRRNYSCALHSSITSTVFDRFWYMTRHKSLHIEQVWKKNRANLTNWERKIIIVYSHTWTMNNYSLCFSVAIVSRLLSTMVMVNAFISQTIHLGVVRNNRP